MKRKITLILTLLILILLLGLLFFVKSQKQAPYVEEGETVNTVSPSPSVASINVIDYTLDDIDHITISDVKNSLTFIPTNGTWQIKDHESTPINQDSLTYRFERILHIEASRSIETDNLSEYGLDNPVETVVYSLKNGTEVKLLVGASTLDTTSSYIMLDGNNTTVYLVNSIIINSFTTTTDELRTTKLEDFFTEDVVGIVASGRNIDNIEIKPSEEQHSLIASYDLTTPKLSKIPIDSNQYKALLDKLPTFTIKEFIADGVTDLSEYGLDNPQLHLVINIETHEGDTKGMLHDSAKTLDYIWGDTLENGLITFMKTGDTSVYAMDSSFLDPFLKALDPFTLCSKIIGVVPIDKVSSMELKLVNNTYTFEIDEANTTYSINGKAIEKDTFKSIYATLVKLKADQEMTDETIDATSSAPISIIYHLLDGTTEAYNFYPSSSEQFLLTKFNESMLVGCSIKQFEYLESLIQDALAK